MRGVEWHYGASLLSEYDADGFLGIQIDAYGEERSGVPTFEQLHPGGVQHRPRDPDDEGQAAVLYFWEGAQGFAVSVTDPRILPFVPSDLPKGSTVLYAHTAPGRKSYILLDGDGDLTIRTEGSGGTSLIKLPGSGGDIEANGGKITSDGDFVTPLGVSLKTHKHPTAMGPSGVPLPG